MIVLIIVRSSSKMGTVAPVVSEIFEKTGAYVNRMFLQKQIFFLKLIKIETKIINKLHVAMETVSRAYFACIVKFFARIRLIGLVGRSVCPSVCRKLSFRPHCPVLA